MTDLFRNDIDALVLHNRIVGIDEAGRGCLAGPVVIAGVELDYRQSIEGLNDSKQLSKIKREKLYEIIIISALRYWIVEIDKDYIDRHNILRATLRGMADVMEALDADATTYLVDGNHAPLGVSRPVIPVIKGDATHACISAASILAKVYRDRLMYKMHSLYPVYGFDRHAGYGTAQHLRALREHGPSPIHRMSFKPVAMCLDSSLQIDFS